MAEQKPFSVEEYEALVSGGGAPRQDAAPAPAPQTAPSSQPDSAQKPFSLDEYEQLTQKKPAPTVGFGEDLARSIGAGAGRGAIGLTGLPGDVENLYNMAREKIFGTKPSERVFPTSEEMTQKATQAFPELQKHLDYKPAYDINKYAKTVGEFLPSAVIPGGGLGLGARAAGAVGAGLATQGAENLLAGTPVEGTGWETGAKIAASIPGFMAGTKATSALQNIAGGTIRSGAEAERRLAREMAKDIAGGGKYGAPMSAKEAIESGVEMAPAAIAGKNTNTLLAKSAERVAPEVVGTFEANMQPIRQNATQRLSNYINETLNIADDSRPFADIAAIRSRAAAMNDTNYNRVMSLPQASNISGPDLMGIVDKLPNGVVKNAFENLRESGLSPTSVGAIQTKNGFAINPQGMHLRFWDEIKRSLDTSIRKLKDPMTGTISDTTAWGNWNKTNSELKSALDSRVKEYGAIRGAAAEAAGAANAIELGTKYLQISNPKQLYNIEKVYSKMSPSEQFDFANGVIGQYKTLLEQDPKKAMTLFSGSKGGERVRRFNQALQPFGDNFGYDLVGRANAEFLNASAASLRPSSGQPLSARLLPLATAAPGAFATIGEMLLQNSIWAGNPQAIMTALAGAGLGKVYNWKEARIAAKVLDYASDPDKMVKLGKLIADRPEAQSFITKTTNLIGRTAAPAMVSDDQSFEPEQREGRATGGRIGGVAARLMNEAARAHKYHQKTTEEILDAPDEHVVKALAVANKHI